MFLSITVILLVTCIEQNATEQKKIPLPHYLLFQWTGCNSDCELRGGGFWVVAQRKAFFLFSFFGCCSIYTISNRPRSHFGSCEQVCIFSVFLLPPSLDVGSRDVLWKIKAQHIKRWMYLFCCLGQSRTEQKPRR